MNCHWRWDFDPCHLVTLNTGTDNSYDPQMPVGDMYLANDLKMIYIFRSQCNYVFGDFIHLKNFQVNPMNGWLESKCYLDKLHAGNLIEINSSVYCMVMTPWTDCSTYQFWEHWLIFANVANRFAQLPSDSSQLWDSYGFMMYWAHAARCCLKSWLMLSWWRNYCFVLNLWILSCVNWVQSTLPFIRIHFNIILMYA